MAVNLVRGEKEHAEHIARMKVEDRPVPNCPRCGFVASENTTKYGLRNDCCGLWSWNRMPLADAKTHEARKHLGPLFSSLAKALGSVQFYTEMRKRVDVKRAEEMTISTMNEVTANKFRAAAEDLLMEMMAGTVVANPTKTANATRRK
jgi:hypothetical protein